MEIEKLIERLQNWDGIKPDREIDCAIEGLKALQAENDRLKRERDAAVGDLETIMAYGGGNLDTCQFCKNSQCYARGGTKHASRNGAARRRTDMERLTHDADIGLEDWEETLFFVKSDPSGAYNILDIARFQGEAEFDEILKNIALRLAAYEDTGLTPEEVQQMRWIPVEERLPDKPGHYLVCTNVNYWHGGCMDKNGASSNAGTTDGYAGTTLSVLDCFCDITGDWNRVCNAHVTHWMPVPKPPKEASHD